MLPHKSSYRERKTEQHQSMSFGYKRKSKTTMEYGGNFVYYTSAIQQDRVTNDAQEFTDELCCEICQGLLWRPVSCSFCQHLFCSQCIRKWLSFKPNSCPFRCSQYEEKRAPPAIHSLLSHLSIRCRNTLYGCTEIVSYNSLEIHETIQCQFATKSCNLCGKYILVKDFVHHEASCTPTMVACWLCQSFIHRTAYQEHTDQCLQEKMNSLINRVIATPQGVAAPTNDDQPWVNILQSRLQQWVIMMGNVDLIGLGAVAEARQKDYLTRIRSMLQLMALNRSRAIYILFCLLCGGIGNILGCLLIVSAFVQDNVNKRMFRSFTVLILFSGIICFSLPVLLANMNDTSIILLTIVGLAVWSSASLDIPLEHYRLGFSSKLVLFILFINLLFFKISLLVFRFYMRYIPPYISAGFLAWTTVFVTYNLRFF